jgi:hypothetical protein
MGMAVRPLIPVFKVLVPEYETRAYEFSILERALNHPLKPPEYLLPLEALTCIDPTNELYSMVPPNSPTMPPVAERFVVVMLTSDLTFETTVVKPPVAVPRPTRLPTKYSPLVAGIEIFPLRVKFSIRLFLISANIPTSSKVSDKYVGVAVVILSPEITFPPPL